LYVRQSANGFYYVNGTPTDCVHVAVTGFLNERPDLVVSGINNGQNVAEDTLYSGTVAAAMEGFLLGIPAVAFSLADRGFGQLDTAVHVAQRVVAGLIRRPFPVPCLLNVNIPSVPLGDLKGYRVCRLGRRHVAQAVLRVSSPRGEPMYWVGAPGAIKEAGPGTDFHALANGEVSITPLRVDLGDAQTAEGLSEWLEALP
jgi:5'-nucleotidase